MKILMKILKYIGIVLIICALLIGALVYFLFYDMNRLPEGELINEVESTNGTYSVRAYLVNPHATVSYAIRVELVFNHKNKKSKNIYWKYKEEKASIYWIDDQTVSINNKVLKVPKEVYDWRRKSYNN